MIWIRKEDEEKWGAIENKPEWLHEHLNDGWKQDAKLSDKLLKGDVLRERIEPEIMIAEHPALPKEWVGKKLCEHYQPKGKCLVKGCK